VIWNNGADLVFMWVGFFVVTGKKLEVPGADGRTILKYVLKEQRERAWSGSILLRIGTTGGML
jgi:hypothetical protein